MLSTSTHCPMLSKVQPLSTTFSTFAGLPTLKIYLQVWGFLVSLVQLEISLDVKDFS